MKIWIISSNVGHCDISKISEIALINHLWKYIFQVFFNINTLQMFLN